MIEENEENKPAAQEDAGTGQRLLFSDYVPLDTPILLCPLNSFLPCIKNRCAWRFDRRNSCAIHVIAMDIEDIARNISQINFIQNATEEE